LNEINVYLATRSIEVSREVKDILTRILSNLNVEYTFREYYDGECIIYEFKIHVDNSLNEINEYLLNIDCEGLEIGSKDGIIVFTVNCSDLGKVEKRECMENTLYYISYIAALIGIPLENIIELINNPKIAVRAYVELARAGVVFKPVRLSFKAWK